MAARAAHSYRRIVELGRGGMATVHLAALRSTGGHDRLVVVKEMRPDFAVDAELRRMFEEEARLATRMSHANVVETFEAIEDPPGVYCIVMEFLDGQPLSRVRSAARREVILPLLLYVAQQALAGLEYVHASGLVHRDVSPQNIFVTYDGDVKLLDFGVAKSIDSAVQTSVGMLKGKLGYMAPEQVLGQPVDARTDIYAMGVVVWEALVGRRLWQDTPEAAIIGRVTSADLPRARSVKPDIPQSLDDICARAMARSPGDRYATAAEFRRDLEAFIDRMTTRPTRKQLAHLLVGLFSEHRRVLREKIEEANAAHTLAGVTAGSRREARGVPAAPAPGPRGDARALAATPAPSTKPEPVRAQPNRTAQLVLASALVASAAAGALVIGARGGRSSVIPRNEADHGEAAAPTATEIPSPPSPSARRPALHEPAAGSADAALLGVTRRPIPAPGLRGPPRSATVDAGPGARASAGSGTVNDRPPDLGY